jgi:hypothetical protein
MSGGGVRHGGLHETCKTEYNQLLSCIRAYGKFFAMIDPKLMTLRSVAPEDMKFISKEW